MKKLNFSFHDFALLLLSALYVVGMHTFLKPCGSKPDGTWMNCHWAGQALKAFSLVLFIIAFTHFWVQNSKIKLGLSVATIPVALFSALIPGVYIKLCMMNTMRCHSVTQPSAIVISVLLIVFAIFDIIKNAKKE